MKKRRLKVQLLSSLLVMGSFLVVTGCSDSDYDFNNIDATMGFGGDGLELPASSTDSIMLKDVLDLVNNGSVVEDDVTHNYVFRQNVNQASPVQTSIDKITITERVPSTTHNITLSLASNARDTRAAGYALRGEGDIFTFDYEGQKPAAVVSLSHADVASNINLNVKFSGLSSWVGMLDKVVLTFPSYMEMECNQGTVSGNNLTLNNIDTSRELNLVVKVKGVDFTKGKESGLTFGDKIKMTGKVHMAVEASNVTLGTTTSAQIQNTLSMSSIVINGATGKFDPSINLTNLGKVDITGIPNFLQGGNVVVDLYNPVIKLLVSNDMALEGIINGTIKSVKNGNQIAKVDVKGIPVGADQLTTIYICRTSQGVPTGEGIVVKEVPNLSDIIKTIPDHITFDADVHANTEKEGTFLLGYQYTVSPYYSVDAPIAFGKDACIEYADNFDGWNDDIKDLNLAKNAYVEMTANVSSKVPAYLNITATPVDVKGQEIDKSQLEVAVDGIVEASKDGVLATTSKLTVKITQKSDDAFKKLDGIKFVVSGKASNNGQSVTGITLNAENQKLKLTDIKIKLVGKVIGDFN